MRIQFLSFYISCQLFALGSFIGSTDDPQLAANGSGNVVALWEEYESSHFAVRTANYLADSGWQAASTLSVGSNDAFDPAAIMNSAGDLIAVWRQYTNGYYATYAATTALGVDWSAPTQISAEDSNFATVGLDANGYGIAIWQQRFDANTFELASASLTPGSGWSAASAFSGVSNVLMSPKVRTGTGGRTIASWQISSVPGPHFRMAVQGAFYSVEHGWSVPTTLSDITHDAVSPRVAISSTGESIVVWEGGEDSGFNRIAAAALSAGGAWTASVFLSEDSIESSCPYSAMNDSGQAIVVWQAKNGSDVNAMAIIRAADGTWGTPTELTPSGVYHPEAAINDSGKAVAIWVDSGRVMTAIYSGSTWGAPTAISAAEATASDPEVRVNTNGSALVAWQSVESSTASILSARLATDNTWGAPVKIN